MKAKETLKRIYYALTRDDRPAHERQPNLENISDMKNRIKGYWSFMHILLWILTGILSLVHCT